MLSAVTPNRYAADIALVGDLVRQQFEHDLVAQLARGALGFIRVRDDTLAYRCHTEAGKKLFRLRFV